MQSKLLFGLIISNGLSMTMASGSKELESEIQALQINSTSEGFIRLNTSNHMLQSVNKQGQILSEVSVSPEQEMDIYRNVIHAIEQAEGENSHSQPPEHMVHKRGCQQGAVICSYNGECRQYDCENCYYVPSVGKGVCYGFTR